MERRSGHGDATNRNAPDPANGEGFALESDGNRAARGAALGRPILPRALVAAGILLAAAATLAASAGLASFGLGLRPLWGWWYPVLLGLCACSGALALRSVLLLVPRLGEGGAGLVPAHLRLFLSATVLTLLVHSLALQPFRAPVALATVSLAGGVFAALCLWIAAHGGWRGSLGRTLDLLVFSLSVTLLALELGLGVLAAQITHPLLTGVVGDSRAHLAASRMQPGMVRFRFPVNSRGDYDHEWNGRSAGRRLVVTIGDSFSAGVVPQPLHFTSVAERLLEDTDVYNMGAPGIGLPEYLLLLVEEALPMEPDLVVVNVFIGNDLLFRPYTPKDSPRWRAWMDADELVLARCLRRLSALSQERRRLAGGPVGDIQGVAEHGEFVLTPEAAHAAFPFTLDPALERATFSEDFFQRMQAQRAAVCRTDRPLFTDALAVLDLIRSVARDVPLALLVIADEFQVQEDQWLQVTSANPDLPLERFVPQTVLREWCAANGVGWIDPTDALLAVPPGADGRRPVYHLRDTHWNALGNRIAGEALAAFVRDRLAR